MSYAELYTDTNILGGFLSKFDAYSEVDTDKDLPLTERERSDLISAIAQLPVVAQQRGYQSAVSVTSIKVASVFVEKIPTNRALPKAGVDEDGSVYLIWNDPNPRCAITFEGTILYTVANPGSNSIHHEPMNYNGGHIPPRILDAIPARK